jgi:hypothetical protein
MPRLINRRHEFFSHLRAQGLRLEEAYERAGYSPDRGHACRLASRPDVAERISELRRDFTDVATAERPRVIEALMSLASDCRAFGTPEGLKEARFAFLEAARLHQQVADDMARDRDIIERELGHLSDRERRGRVGDTKAQAEPESAPEAPPETAPVDALARRAA